MRPIYIPVMAMAVLLSSCVSFADEHKNCTERCDAERDTRNMHCPSPYDTSEASQERSQCLKISQTAYADCVRQCPAPPRSQQVVPPSMGY